MDKKLAVAVISSMIFCGSNVYASPSFFAEVLTTDWSYGAINQLIQTGNIAEYKTTIPEGRVMSRLEMAMIVNEAQKNMIAFSEADQKTILKLNTEYSYDLKKLQILNKIDKLEDTETDAKQAPVQIAKPKLDDKYSFNAVSRIRFENKYQEHGTSTAFKHINLQLYHHYKINDNWTFELGNEFQRSMDTINDEAPRPNDGDRTMQTNIASTLYMSGKIKDTNIKVGRWYDWDVYGFALDGTVVGAEVSFGNKVKTSIFNGRAADWSYNIDKPTTWRDYTALKFKTALDDKSNFYWGAYSMQPLARQYQKTDHSRVLYGYVGYDRQMNKDWNVAAVISDTNAKTDKELLYKDTGRTHTSESPALFTKFTYKKVDLAKPGSYDAWILYLKEPQRAQYGNTNWWESNAEGIRIGGNYVLDKNIVLNAYYTFARDIDTHDKRNGARIELDAFF